MDANEQSPSRYPLPPLAQHHGNSSFSAAQRATLNALSYRDDRSPSASSLPMHRDMHVDGTTDSGGHGGTSSVGIGDAMNHLSEYPRRKAGHRRVASDSLHGFSFHGASSAGGGAGGNLALEEMDVAGASGAGTGLGANAGMEDAMFSDMVEPGMQMSQEGGERSMEGGGGVGGGSSGSLALGFKPGHFRTDSAGSGAGGSSGTIAIGGNGGIGSVLGGGMRSGLGGQNWEGGASGGAGGAGGAAAGGGASGSGGHNRSFSVDDVFLFKAGPFRESLSPIRSPVMVRRGRRGGDSGLSIKDEVDELDDDDAVRRVMASKKPANEAEVIDAKKAKRILANRLSAARSKERKTRYMMELEEKVAHYEKQAHALKTTLAILQREAATLAESNDGMTKKLQLLEQLYQQSEVENKQLHDQVEMLRKAAGLPAHALLPTGAGGMSMQSQVLSPAPAAPAAPALDNQLAQLLKLLQGQPQAVQALLAAQQQQPHQQQQQQQQQQQHGHQGQQLNVGHSLQQHGQQGGQGQMGQQGGQQNQAQQQALFLSQGLFNNL